MENNSYEIYDFGEIERILLETKNRKSAYSSEIFMEKLKENISISFSNLIPTYISVDIFDTLVLRNDVSELKKFYDIAEIQIEYLKLNSNIYLSSYQLIDARLTGTRMTYKVSEVVNGCREGKILDIYDYIASEFSLEESTKLELIKIEIEHEIKSLYPNYGLIECLQHYISLGSKVLLISDMYLDSQSIKKILLGLSIELNDYEYVISSADTTFSKSSGKLFDFVRELLGEKDFSSWVHMGDSLKGDVHKPTEKGIHSIYLPLSNETVMLRSNCYKTIKNKLESEYVLHTGYSS